MPALPQQIACSAGSTSSRPGIGEHRARRVRTPWACRRWQESWKATRAGAAAARPRGSSSASNSDTSRTRTGRSRVLQVRAAAGGVDDDRVDAANFSAIGRRGGGPPQPSGVDVERAAALLPARRDDLEPSAARTRAVAALTSAEDDALHAAGQEPDAPAAPPRAASSGGARSSATAAASANGSSRPRQPAAQREGGRSRRGCGTVGKISARRSRSPTGRR